MTITYELLTTAVLEKMPCLSIVIQTNVVIPLGQRLFIEVEEEFWWHVVTTCSTRKTMVEVVLVDFLGNREKLTANVHVIDDYDQIIELY